MCFEGWVGAALTRLVAAKRRSGEKIRCGQMDNSGRLLLTNLAFRNCLVPEKYRISFVNNNPVADGRQKALSRSGLNFGQPYKTAAQSNHEGGSQYRYDARVARAPFGFFTWISL